MKQKEILKMKLNRKNKKAFTIVELVIVIGVIGILSAILIPTFANLTNKANDAKTKEELAGAYTAYVTDVADGYYGEPTTSAADKMYAQNEVGFAKTNNATTFFTYGDNGWTTAQAAVAGKTGTLLNSTAYNGYFIYKLVNAA